jgi:hypothetical protein
MYKEVEDTVNTEGDLDEKYVTPKAKRQRRKSDDDQKFRYPSSSKQIRLGLMTPTAPGRRTTAR